MADPPASPTPYRLSYSGRVQDEVAELINHAKGSARHPLLIAAARTIDYRLRVYPQFGDPLRDLTTEPGHYRIGVVPPLVVRYVVYEERRLVCVVTPFQMLGRGS
jgi:hypothetical protein